MKMGNGFFGCYGEFEPTASMYVYKSKEDYEENKSELSGKGIIFIGMSIEEVDSILHDLKL